MPSFARKQIVREGEIGIYHTWSRCVQKAFLCGFDPQTHVDFDYRRDWIKSLLQYQASVFAIDVGNYSILSNHQHLIARTRPDIALQWSDEEVAWRWKLAWPSWIDGQWVREPTDQEIAELLAKPHRIPKIRSNLASLSWFMARWKEPIARMANAESDKKGHFYEQRYGSRELVDDPGSLCCNIYLDLNQLKAGMARALEESRCSAIQDRLQSWREQQAQASVEAFQANAPPGYSLEAGDVQSLFADCFLAPIGDKHPPVPEHTPNRLILPGSSAALPIPEHPVVLPSPVEFTAPEIAEPAPTDQVVEPSTDKNVSAADSDAVVSTTLGSCAALPIQERPVVLLSTVESTDSEIAESAPTDQVVEPSTDTNVSAADSDVVDSTTLESPKAVESHSSAKRRGRQPHKPPAPTRAIHGRLQSGRRKRASDHAYLGIPQPQYLAIVTWTAEQFLAARDNKTPSRAPPDNVVEILRQWGIAPELWYDVIDKFESWFHRAVGHAKKLAEPIQRGKKRWIQGIRSCRQVFT